MNDTIVALRSEVAELRSALTDLSKKHGAMASSAGCNQWTKVVGKHVRNQHANPSKSVTVQLLSAKSGLGTSNSPMILSSYNRPLRPSRSMRQSCQHKMKPRVLVEGKRQIWGTMKTTSTAAVSYTISTLTKPAGLLVKRKFKTSHGENST